MKDKIICASIESLRQEGLKFSVDTLANKLRISKKTIYKFFPDKEALALAIYEKYYTEAKNRAEVLVNSNDSSSHLALLHLYFDSKTMIRRGLFNKYKLNDSIYSFAKEQNDALWDIISTYFKNIYKNNSKNNSNMNIGNNSTNNNPKQHMETLRLIIDGSFEKLCNEKINPDDVIERLVELL